MVVWFVLISCRNTEFVEQVDLFVLKYRMKFIQFGEKKRTSNCFCFRQREWRNN